MKVQVYLNLPGNAAEAFEIYRSARRRGDDRHGLQASARRRWSSATAHR